MRKNEHGWFLELADSVQVRKSNMTTIPNDYHWNVSKYVNIFFSSRSWRMTNRCILKNTFMIQDQGPALIG